MKRRRKLKRQMARPKHNPVSVTFKLDGDLKDDFERVLAKHGRFHTNTAFWIACMEALILQMRRGEHPAYPLEFVTKQPEAAPEPVESKVRKVKPVRPAPLKQAAPPQGPYPHH